MIGDYQVVQLIGMLPLPPEEGFQKQTIPSLWNVNLPNLLIKNSDIFGHWERFPCFSKDIDKEAISQIALKILIKTSADQTQNPSFFIQDCSGSDVAVQCHTPVQGGVQLQSFAYKIYFDYSGEILAERDKEISTIPSLVANFKKQYAPFPKQESAQAIEEHYASEQQSQRQFAPPLLNFSFLEHCQDKNKDLLEWENFPCFPLDIDNAAISIITRIVCNKMMTAPSDKLPFYIRESSEKGSLTFEYFISKSKKAVRYKMYFDFNGDIYLESRGQRHPIRSVLAEYKQKYCLLPENEVNCVIEEYYAKKIKDRHDEVYARLGEVNYTHTSKEAESILEHPLNFKLDGIFMLWEPEKDSENFFISYVCAQENCIKHIEVVITGRGKLYCEDLGLEFAQIQKSSDEELFKPGLPEKKPTRGLLDYLVFENILRCHSYRYEDANLNEELKRLGPPGENQSEKLKVYFRYNTPFWK